MKVKDLIGHRVMDIREEVVLRDMDGWLDKGDAWVVLDDGKVIGIPFSLDGDVWIRELPGSARSIFPTGRPKVTGYRRWWKFWIPFSRPAEWDIRGMRGQRIIDVVSVSDDRCAFIQLEGGSLFSVEQVAPHGTGSAGVELIRSAEEFEARWGKEVQRLSQLPKAGSR